MSELFVMTEEMASKLREGGAKLTVQELIEWCEAEAMAFHGDKDMDEARHYLTLVGGLRGTLWDYLSAHNPTWVMQKRTENGRRVDEYRCPCDAHKRQAERNCRFPADFPTPTKFHTHDGAMEVWFPNYGTPVIVSTRPPYDKYAVVRAWLHVSGNQSKLQLAEAVEDANATKFVKAGKCKCRFCLDRAMQEGPKKEWEPGQEGQFQV